MNGRSLLIPIAFIFVYLACPVGASAHRLDEYLQATRLSVERDRVTLEIDLTAGVNVASQVFALIDSNRDGLVSPAEGEAYAQLVLNSIALAIDGRPLPVVIADRSFPEFREMTEGVGTIRLRAFATMPSAGAGRHQVYYRNTHESEIGAYLVNALIPTDRQIEIAGQRRDFMQHELTVDYNVIAESRWSALWWLIIGLAMAGVLAATRLNFRDGRFVSAYLGAAGMSLDATRRLNFHRPSSRTSSSS